MSDLPSSPGGQAQDEPASTSATAETEHRGPTVDGGYGLPAFQPRLQSRHSSRSITPLQSGRATPSALEAVFHSDMATFRDGQISATATMERYMAQNAQVLTAMMASQESFRIDLEERLNAYSQHVQVPLTQAVNLSAEASSRTEAMSATLVNLQVELSRAYNVAQQANFAAEANRQETVRQSEIAARNLSDARAALEAARPSSSSTTVAERLTAQLAELNTEDVQAPRRPSIASEFGPRSNAFSPPASVRFTVPSMAESRTQNHQEPPRMNYLERPQVQTSSNGPIGMSVDLPVYQPQGPQVIIIQRAAVDLLNHVPMYNGESTAAAISFIGAAENAKRNEAETSARMIVAVGARLSGRASQWFETVSSSKLRDNASNPGVMVDTLPNNDFGWNFFTKTFLANFTSSTETFDLRDQLKKLVWNPEKDAIKAHILTMTTILHSMALLGDALTDRDKVEYFMSSLVKKSHLVRKINLTSTFDQACRDIVDYVSKEQIAKTIIDQHAYKQPAGAKLYNLEPCSDDDDYEANSHANRTTATLNLLYNAELNAMRMAWLDKLNPEERRRFDNQLCIGCGDPGHVRRDCPHLQPPAMNGTKTVYPRNVDNSGAQRGGNFPRPQAPGNTMNKPKNGPGPLPKNYSYPVNNNNPRPNTQGNLPKHNMGG
jgi:hypothetical protein